MSIDFDRRARAVTNTGAAENNPSARAESASAETADPLETLMNPTQAVSEMQLLFSGTRNLRSLREDHPLEELNIPELGRDILGPMPAAGATSGDLQRIIERYRQLRLNLIERRNNYAHALEGFLYPEEAMDLYERIEQIDDALLKIEQEMDQAGNRKSQLEFLERERRIETLLQQEREERDG